MLSLYLLGAFLLGYVLCAITAMGGPVSLTLARYRGFWVGWDARERYPADALPRTRAEVSRLLAEDDARLMNGDA